MKNIIQKILITTLFILYSQIVFAQLDISKFSVNIGLRQNYKSDIADVNHFSFYPELKIGGKFITNFLEWNVLSGYFNSSDDDEIDVKDMAFYSHSGFVIGTHINFFPNKLLKNKFLPVYLIGGLSFNSIKEKHIGGADYGGNYRKNNSFIITTVDFGLGTVIPLSRNIQIDFNGILKFPIKENVFLERGGRSSEIKIGVDYLLK